MFYSLSRKDRQHLTGTFTFSGGILLD